MGRQNNKLYVCKNNNNRKRNLYIEKRSKIEYNSPYIETSYGFDEL